MNYKEGLFFYYCMPQKELFRRRDHNLLGSRYGVMYVWCFMVCMYDVLSYVCKMYIWSFMLCMYDVLLEWFLQDWHRADIAKPKDCMLSP